jgi:hypothetical protein
MVGESLKDGWRALCRAKGVIKRSLSYYLISTSITRLNILSHRLRLGVRLKLACLTESQDAEEKLKQEAQIWDFLLVTYT